MERSIHPAPGTFFRGATGVTFARFHAPQFSDTSGFLRMSDVRVDAPPRDFYVARARSGIVGLLGVLATALWLGACAASRNELPPPGPEVQGATSSLRDRTRLEEPVRVLFAWRLNERGSRIGGRGVARMEPPYRARLDLFTENGETAARAALVEGELRLPPEVDRRLIPPAPLLWTALGVFRPGDEARLAGGQGSMEAELLLHYALPGGGALRYDVREGRVRTAELLRDGEVVEQVRLEWTEGERLPREARYRDLAAFRELEVGVESTETVESYDPEIWDPGR